MKVTEFVNETTKVFCGKTAGVKEGIEEIALVSELLEVASESMGWMPHAGEPGVQFATKDGRIRILITESLKREALTQVVRVEVWTGAPKARLMVALEGCAEGTIAKPGQVESFTKVEDNRDRATPDQLRDIWFYLCWEAVPDRWMAPESVLGLFAYATKPVAPVA